MFYKWYDSYKATVRKLEVKINVYKWNDSCMVIGKRVKVTSKDYLLEQS